MTFPTLDPQHRSTPHRSKQHARIARGAGAGAVLTLLLLLTVLAPGVAGAPRDAGVLLRTVRRRTVLRIERRKGHRRSPVATISDQARSVT